MIINKKYFHIYVHRYIFNSIEYSNKYTRYKNTEVKFITLSLKIKIFMTYANF